MLTAGIPNTWWRWQAGPLGKQLTQMTAATACASAGTSGRGGATKAGTGCATAGASGWGSAGVAGALRSRMLVVEELSDATFGSTAVGAGLTGLSAGRAAALAAGVRGALGAAMTPVPSAYASWSASALAASSAAAFSGLGSTAVRSPVRLRSGVEGGEEPFRSCPESSEDFSEALSGRPLSTESGSGAGLLTSASACTPPSPL